MKRKQICLQKLQVGCGQKGVNTICRRRRMISNDHNAADGKLTGKVCTTKNENKASATTIRQSAPKNSTIHKTCWSLLMNDHQKADCGTRLGCKNQPGGGCTRRWCPVCMLFMWVAIKITWHATYVAGRLCLCLLWIIFNFFTISNDINLQKYPRTRSQQKKKKESKR